MSDVKSFESDVKRIADDLKRELAGVRTSRPSAALVEDIKANYYDTPTPIKHLASVGIVLPRQIVIQVWDGGAVASVAPVAAR